MSTETPLAEPTPEDIYQQLADTWDSRASLDEQDGALRDKVMGTANDASAAIVVAIQDAKDTAHAAGDAMRQVATEVALARNTHDIHRHVRRHPGLRVGCSVVLGFGCSESTDYASTTAQAVP